MEGIRSYLNYMRDPIIQKLGVCPSCGGSSVVIDDVMGYYACRCQTCDYTTYYRFTKQEAVEDWNNDKGVHRWSF